MFHKIWFDGLWSNKISKNYENISNENASLQFLFDFQYIFVSRILL